ncbi:hypothetical protein I79_000053 [Cricetulus griseus]|uniref:Uncharacterized protein n=1 Tax=Cricetulus griseus TaxID=10029 RepID=G3GRB0_CRIGR|nr:hypothetical protein I79_000053 [Cricetulus griseus]
MKGREPESVETEKNSGPKTCKETRPQACSHVDLRAPCRKADLSGDHSTAGGGLQSQNLLDPSLYKCGIMGIWVKPLNCLRCYSRKQR